MKNLSEQLEKKLTKEKVQKIAALVERSSKQQKRLDDLLEIYRNIVEAINQKIIKNYKE